MSVVRLVRKCVEKPWGRHLLWPGFDDVPADGAPLGEVWFELPRSFGLDDPEILIKYLFTSERLSIQVHPDDADAQSRGKRRGKSEAWQILWAEPGATIGLGMRRSIDRAELRAAAEDGSITELLDWKPVQAGDFLYSPAGTVHAIGAGLILIEIQQNVDLTYRLYDYGRPRELHLDDGVAVAQPGRYAQTNESYELAPGRQVKNAGAQFVVERWSAPFAGSFVVSPRRMAWLIPIGGTGCVGGEAIYGGNVWLVDAGEKLTLEPGIDMLVAYPGSEADVTLVTPEANARL